MIIEERKLPVKILTLEALLRRLPDNHHARLQIEEEYGIMMAGYKGEKAVDFYLKEIPKENYHVMTGLRIYEGESFFQMDNLIITPKYLLIIEVKNLAGILFFDHQYQQLIRTLNGVEEVFDYPIVQTNRQRKKLSNWLVENKFRPVPIETLVVISNKKAIIKSSIYLEEVIRSPSLPIRIDNLESKYKTKLFTENEMKKLKKLLLKKHVEEKLDYMTRFSMEQTDLIVGPHCPICYSLEITKQPKGWICKNECNFTLVQLLKSSLLDFRYLFSSTITNNQFRYFMRIKSKSTSNHMIRSLGLKPNGAQKNRTYHIPY
ncbi:MULTISPECIES: nuclease-related domain-containing protein [Sutcliffiella]|uniref:NERD domain-containing protein n=1 Tax=Sutcliffiella cohnii TaxID=33932 RepID=A0A223KXH1_9BACI|nr:MULTISPECIES: nuclease-related domain-containing protein [Sutcliffiella]AST94110.1 hypothetical protein BC6307_24090 [Sutcliffiella cohnii]WBL15323.1 nuclease-related domain-containing protein [Sutcliffiella sp. NC1]